MKAETGRENGFRTALNCQLIMPSSSKKMANQIKFDIRYFGKFDCCGVQ